MPQPLISDGKLIGTYHKMYLPNYGVFDENRYFRAGGECPVYVINGIGIGINICEDIWYEGRAGQRYRHTPALKLSLTSALLHTTPARANHGKK